MVYNPSSFIASYAQKLAIMHGVFIISVYEQYVSFHD